MKYIKLILVLVLSQSVLVCKLTNITGKITNSQNNPIIYAKITNTHSGKILYSDNKGEIIMNFIKPVDTLLIQHLLYKDTIVYQKDLLNDFHITISEKKINDIKTEDQKVISQFISLISKPKISTPFYSESFTGYDIDLVSDKLSQLILSFYPFEFPINKWNIENPKYVFQGYSENIVNQKEKINFKNLIYSRQTADVINKNNIGKYLKDINFYNENYLKINNANLISPFANFAVELYEYTLDKIYCIDTDTIAEILFYTKNIKEVGLEGIIQYNVSKNYPISIQCNQNGSTSIYLLDSIRIYQQYEQENNYIIPVVTTFKFDTDWELCKYVAKVKYSGARQTSLNYIDVNKQIPESYSKYKNYDYILQNAYNIDIPDDIFTSFGLITNPPQQIALDNSDKTDFKIKAHPMYNSPIKYEFYPYLVFNRVESVSLGLSPTIHFFNIPILTNAYYSIGQSKYYGDFSIKFNGVLENIVDFNFNFSGFSKIQAIGYDKSFTVLSNTLSAAFTHLDYYDYYYKKGFLMSIGSNYNDLFSVSLSIEFSNQESVSKTTNRSIFFKKDFRDNPQINDDDIKLFSSNLKFGHINLIYPENQIQWELDITPFAGSGKQNVKNFKGAIIGAGIYLPLKKTGYQPISLTLYCKYGIADSNLPVQYQFRMNSSKYLIKNIDNFISVDPNEFGGTNYFEAHLTLNLTDYYWRMWGLPAYNNRGPQILLLYSVGYYDNERANKAFKTTDGKLYAEAGFGLFRIPTFISNVFYWNASVAVGISDIAGNRWGWSLGLEYPLFK